MAIAWKALPVMESLERIERQIDEMEPFIAEALAEVHSAKDRHDLPEYLTQRLFGMEDELSRTLKRLRNRVESARKVIPEDAIKKERRQPTLSL